MPRQLRGLRPGAVDFDGHGACALSCALCVVQVQQTAGGAIALMAIICQCTGATDRDIEAGCCPEAGKLCGGCRPVVDALRPPPCSWCGGPVGSTAAKLLGQSTCVECLGIWTFGTLDQRSEFYRGLERFNAYGERARPLRPRPLSSNPLVRAMEARAIQVDREILADTLGAPENAERR